MTEEYYECPVCEYNDKRDLYETKKELVEHISEGHTQTELAEYIIGDVIRFEYSPEEFGKRKIVKSSSSVLERPYGKTISTPPPPSGSISEEGNIRRIVRDEMHKVLRREHLQK